MKIYTKTGDKGHTGLLGGGRVAKSSPRIQAYGEADELNAILGVVRAETKLEAIQRSLTEVQSSLFVVGAQLASPRAEPNIEVITSAHIDGLERQIDAMTANLPELRNFILPGGTKTAALLHLARTVCRRVERSVVALSELPNESVDHWLVIYLNRLSDYLFVLARLANQLEGVEDVPWRPASQRKKS